MDWIDIDRLDQSPMKPSGFVARPSASLIRRMKEYGAIDPVVVRPTEEGRYEILSRPDVWVAAGALSLHQVPVLIRDDVDDAEAVEIVREHYPQSQDNPIAEAEIFLTIMKRRGWWDGLTKHYPRGAISKVAKEVKRSRPYIANALRLLKLPVAVQEEVRAGNLTVGQARPLLGVPSRSDQIRLARRIKDDGLTAREAESLAKESDRVRSASTATQAAKKSPDLIRLEQKVTALLGTTFSIEGGRAVIDYYDDLSILEGVLERLGYRG